MLLYATLISIIAVKLAFNILGITPSICSSKDTKILYGLQCFLDEY